MLMDAKLSAKRLPYCDHIVALSSGGRILEQGTFDNLNRTGGYVSSFDLPPPDWDFVPEKHVYEAPPKYTERAITGKVTEDDIQAETNRRTGDARIYLYYVQSVGWIATIIFIVSITIFIFGQSFPSKLPPNCPTELVYSLFSIIFPNPIANANQHISALWVKWWASYNAEYPNQRLGYYLGVYAMLGGLALIFLIISCW